MKTETQKPAVVEKTAPAPVKAAKVIKPRLEGVLPTHIVEIWRMVAASLADGIQPYPDVSRDSQEVMQSHLLDYMNRSNFAGLIAKMGKKPAGMILGNLATRPYGYPHRYAFIWTLWVEPAYRKHGIAHLLWNEYTKKMKEVGIHHWEALVTDQLMAELAKGSKFPVQRYLSVIGGQIHGV